MIKKHFNKPIGLLNLLIVLTVILVCAQISFFIIHYKVSDLMDSLVQSSLKTEILHPIILLPIAGFILIQLISYCLFVAWSWATTIAVKNVFQFSERRTFWLGLFIWLINCCSILSLNNYFYPDSFFATLLPTNNFLLIFSISSCAFLTGIFLFNFFWKKQQIRAGKFFLALCTLFFGFSIYTSYATHAIVATNETSQQPNIILIGLDSLRPDFVSYVNPHAARTPNIDAFYQSATVFTQAYTPLARTFPAWMSILTSRYPKHSNARTNLADPDSIHADETLATKLRAAGYETIYGTDEKRFSNITARYGFNHIIGPHIGVNDFILGGLSDFPLTNLLINSSLGRILFPFNYGNRATAITYEPNKFLNLVQLSLANREKKPLFLAIHLCVSHWPYTWARDQQSTNATLPERYQSSVAAVDQQLGDLLQILKENNLLKNSVVVLLSDHGTTVGLPNDRLVNVKNYHGDSKKIKWLPFYMLSTAKDFSNDFKKDFTINTSYGQGTDVLSLKQYHVLLAFKGFGINIPHQQKNNTASLLDIAPTLLEFLKIKPLKNTDGVSLAAAFANKKSTSSPRAIFLETGYSISDITTKDIFIEKVVKHSISIYGINAQTGQLYVKSNAEKSVLQNKQRAVLLGDWLLARYPKSLHSRLVLNGKNLSYQNYEQPAFFVLANIKNGQWEIGLDTPISKEAPLKELKKKFNEFYGDEI